MDEEVFVYSPDLSLLKAGCYTLTLTGEEADAVRSALARYANRMWHSVLAAKNQGNSGPCDDYNAVIKACDRVVEKLNKAEGRG